MTTTRSGGGPDDVDTGTWATETLPMSVRKELLERELSKLGFRKAAAQGGGSGHESTGQPQSGGSSSHPQADGHGDSAHGG